MNMIWLDYKKAYDSVPYAWIIEALRLRIGKILYKKGIFQGDYLSVILFILSLNPLLFWLNETDGYKMAINTIYEKILTHLFFVDDLRLYAATLQQSKLQLDIFYYVLS